MYFKHISPLSVFKESMSYTLKNLIDLFTLPSDDFGKNVKEKIRRVEEEYFKNYVYNGDTERAILNCINNMHNREFDVLDLEKLDRTFHLKLRLQSELKGDTLSKADWPTFYITLYREFFIAALPSYFSKYTFIRLIDNKYIIFITFDEKEIEAVHTIGAENQFDFTSNVNVLEIKVDKSIFQKSNVS